MPTCIEYYFVKYSNLSLSELRKSILKDVKSGKLVLKMQNIYYALYILDK